MGTSFGVIEYLCNFPRRNDRRASLPWSKLTGSTQDRPPQQCQLEGAANTYCHRNRPSPRWRSKLYSAVHTYQSEMEERQHVGDTTGVPSWIFVVARRRIPAYTDSNLWFSFDRTTIALICPKLRQAPKALRTILRYRLEY